MWGFLRSDTWQDVRYGARPRAARHCDHRVAPLAIGIGFSAGVFSLADAFPRDRSRSGAR